MCDRLVDLLDSVLCTFVYFVTSGSIDKAYRKRNGFPARTRDTSTPKVECFVVSLFSLSSAETKVGRMVNAEASVFCLAHEVLLVNISDFVQREIPFVEQNTKIAGRHLENWR